MIFRHIYWAAAVCICVLRLGLAEQPHVIGSDAVLPHDPRQDHERYVTWHPIDGQEVDLNPPRFRWPYDMSHIRIEGSVAAETKWDFQIASTPFFQRPVFAIRGVAYNFFNAVPSLEGDGPFYWRVREVKRDGLSRWSKARKFSIASDAKVWDRSQMLDRNRWSRTHPRLYWNETTWDAVLRRSESEPLGQQGRKHILEAAEQFVKSNVWDNFPQNDDDRSKNYMSLTKGVLLTALAHKITGDGKFDGHKERMLLIASWEKGRGHSSPEALHPNRNKWSTHLNGLLALYYDWLYHDLTLIERGVFQNSLMWRLEHTLWSFVFTQNQGTKINGKNLGIRGASHTYEALMVSLPGLICIWEEVPDAEVGLEWALNYLAGVTTPYGKLEAHSQGVGYANGKSTWMIDAAWAVRTALPHVQIEKLPHLDGLSEFVSFITPIGLDHSSGGNRAFDETDWTMRRYINNILLGYLTGNGNAIANAEATASRLEERGLEPAIYSPWVAISAAGHVNRPEPSSATRTERIWSLAGIVAVATEEPSDYKNWKDNVGMIFYSRPAGGYDHSFRMDNSFDIFAYGQVLAHGGGGTKNGDKFGHASMSHNTVLINGRGQTHSQSRVPYSARLVAYEDHSDFKYFAGDATNAYASSTGLQRFVRHVLFMRGAYFIIYDDLSAKEPAKYQWLYHLHPNAEEFNILPGRGFDLKVNGVRMQVQHVTNASNPEIENRQGDMGRRNPFTREDYRRARRRRKFRKRNAAVRDSSRYAHHIWVNTASQALDHHFLTILYPYKDGENPCIINTIGDKAVNVTMPNGTQDIVAFGEPVPSATMIVKIDEMRENSIFDAT